MTADQHFWAILPITSNLGSSSTRAGISTRSGSAQSSCASRKLIPCFARLDWLLESSNSNPTLAGRYRNYTFIILIAIANFYPASEKQSLPPPPVDRLFLAISPCVRLCYLAENCLPTHVIPNLALISTTAPKSTTSALLLQAIALQDGDLTTWFVLAKSEQSTIARQD